MYKIGVITTTRAEYGLLRLTIKEIIKDPVLELCLFVSGTHLSEEHGYTVKEIEEDGIDIAERIPVYGKNFDSLSLCLSMGDELKEFSRAFDRQKPDVIIVLGDRYEMLPICYSALMQGIPIAHISGGEITEGVIDDTIRHCLTKMSFLHFAGCETYRQRIIGLGEEPERVFNFGDPGVENILKLKLLSKEELLEGLKINAKADIACVTFHPVTRSNDRSLVEKQVRELIAAMDHFKDIEYIITMANADSGGSYINEMFRESLNGRDNFHMYPSLGIIRYLSALSCSEFVLGNSSSGIVEAPSFKIPTVNIGDRQKGRLRSESVIDCEPEEKAIESAIRKALSPEFKKTLRTCVNPYGAGDFSRLCVAKIKEFLESGRIRETKRFYEG